MSQKTLSQKSDSLSLLSIVRGLRSYTLATLGADLFAAISVALVALPQSIAYSLLAGLPPSVGIFAAIFGTIFTASFGRSRHLIAGPTSAMAILLQVATSEILFAFYHDVDPAHQQAIAVHIVVELTFLVGTIQFLMAIMRLDRLAQFVSRPVVMGYVIGVSIAIVIGQLFAFLGVPSLLDPQPVYAKIGYLLTHLDQISPWTVGIGAGSLLFLLGIKRFGRRVPAAAVMLCLAALAVYLMGNSGHSVQLIGHYGSLDEVYPTVGLPYLDFRILNVVIPFAFAIALLGSIEVMSIVKSLAAHSRQNVAVGQEILGLGLANVIASFFGAMPSSGSFSRSRLNCDSGAKTHLAAIISGLLVALLVYCVGSLVGYIPLAAVAALLLVTAVTFVDWRQLKLCITATRSDALAFGVTLICCLVFSLDVAFYIGVVISLALYLRAAARPAVQEMTIGPRGQARPMAQGEQPPSDQIRIIDVDGDLFFGAVDFFQGTLQAIAEDEAVKVVILRLKNAHHLDASACLALQQLHSYLQEEGRRLILCGLTKQVYTVLRRSGLSKTIGQENLLISDPLDAIGSTGKAFMQAEKLLSI